MFAFQKSFLRGPAVMVITLLLPLSINAQSLIFNGSSDYVDCGNDASLQITGAITVEAWINTTGPDGSWAAIVSKLVHTATQEGFELGIYDDRRIFFTVGRNWGDVLTCISFSSIPSGINTHVKGTYDGSHIRIYINGSLDSPEAAYGNGIVDSGTSLNIGRRHNAAGTFFKGSIDDVRISDGSGQVAWYPMNEGSGTTLNDNSSNTNTGTIYGAAWSDQSLPVEISSFTAQIENGSIVVKWTTESEVDNLGFILERSEEDKASWQIIASHTTHDALKGQGNTSSRTEYSFTDRNAEPGKVYWYRLSDVKTNGEITLYAPLSIQMGELPESTVMENAYPNPFNPQTYIACHLADAADVNISVFDILGRKVKTLFTGQQQAGSYHIYWNGTDENGLTAPGGNYIIRMQTQQATQIQKVTFMK